MALRLRRERFKPASQLASAATTISSSRSESLPIPLGGLTSLGGGASVASDKAQQSLRGG